MSDPQNPNPYDSHDPADQTERHALPPAPAESGRYSPAPESRPDWAERATWSSQTHQPTQERWYEPATPAPATNVTPERPRRGSGAGTVVGAALLAAALASGGTVIALNATGAYDQQVQSTSSPVGATVSARQPVTIDESSAIIDVAAKAGPAVVKITVKTKPAPARTRGRQPAQPGPGSPFDFFNFGIPDEPVDRGGIGTGTGFVVDKSGFIAKSP